MEQDDPKQRWRDALDSILGTPEPPPMRELVARLDAWLSRNRPDYYAQLLPGLSSQEWTAFAKRLGVDMPDGFRVLYQWRNGHLDNPAASFHRNRNLMQAEEVLSKKELMDSMIGADFEPGWWECGWVPFLHNGAGSHLCVDTVGANGGKPGQLVEFWNRDRDRPVISPSIEHWLNHFVTSLERDEWEETQYGFECVRSATDTQ